MSDPLMQRVNDDLELLRIRAERDRQLKRFGVKPKRPELVEVVGPNNPVLIRSDRVEAFNRLRAKGKR